MVSMSMARAGQGIDGPDAPIYDVPDQRVVSIEHPCIVKNLDRGLKSLGGEAQIQHVSCMYQHRCTFMFTLPIFPTSVD